MDFDLGLVWRSLPYLLAGARTTILLTTASVGLGLVIGTIVGMARLSTNSVIYYLASAYVDFFRGTPLMVQILLLFFGLPVLLGDVFIPRLVAGIVALGLNSGAYIAEIVRAGIQSIDQGQVEAAHSLGMTRVQTMALIVLPQAIRRIIPPLGNEFVALLKDSSLVAVISVEELLRRGQLVITRSFRPFEIYLEVALIYLIMTKIISKFVDYTERRLHVGRHDHQNTTSDSTTDEAA